MAKHTNLIENEFLTDKNAHLQNAIKKTWSVFNSTNLEGAKSIR